MVIIEGFLWEVRQIYRKVSLATWVFMNGRSSSDNYSCICNKTHFAPLDIETYGKDTASQVSQSNSK